MFYFIKKLFKHKHKSNNLIISDVPSTVFMHIAPNKDIDVFQKYEKYLIEAYCKKNIWYNFTKQFYISDNGFYVYQVVCTESELESD